ncbi:hypothetical protein FHS27_006057 [Rhodopirellula rubra]|uniref:Uncharacterized protein n=1 Tax=Aporhodopirellula rubra TaxID=980271 RepID=A0A7W5E4T4_9BACT|nr:hypothetical protein [Aporhodopirellula rubra]
MPSTLGRPPAERVRKTTKSSPVEVPERLILTIVAIVPVTILRPKLVRDTESRVPVVLYASIRTCYEIDSEHCMQEMTPIWR